MTGSISFNKTDYTVSSQFATNLKAKAADGLDQAELKELSKGASESEAKLLTELSIQSKVSLTIDIDGAKAEFKPSELAFEVKAPEADASEVSKTQQSVAGDNKTNTDTKTNTDNKTNTDTKTDPGARPPVKAEDRAIVKEAVKDLEKLIMERRKANEFAPSAGDYTQASRLATKMLELGYSGDAIEAQLAGLRLAQTPEDVQKALKDMDRMSKGDLDETTQKTIDEMMDNNGTVTLTEGKMKEFLAKAGIDVKKFEAEIALAFGSNKTKVSINGAMFATWLKSVAIMQGGTDRAAYDAKMVAQNLGGMMSGLTNSILAKLNSMNQPNVTTPEIPKSAPDKGPDKGNVPGTGPGTGPGGEPGKGKDPFKGGVKIEDGEVKFDMSK